jgi:2-oxoisovalerate dehydrogenase E1 component beta subunit
MSRIFAMAEITLIEGIRQAMDEELARDERVFIVGEDVGPRGGVFRATLDLFDKYGPDRVIDSFLAELSIVGIGVGAALYGARPICEIQFADFIHPAFNQIVNEAAKMCYRSNGEWTVPMVIRAPYGGGVGGGLYHSQSVEAFFTHVPGLKVVIPSTPYDAKGLLKSAVRDPNPVMFFEPKKGYRLIRG